MKSSIENSNENITDLTVEAYAVQLTLQLTWESKSFWADCHNPVRYRKKKKN